MRHSLATATSLLAALSPAVLAADTFQQKANSTCNQIQTAISGASTVHWPWLQAFQFNQDLSHFSVSSDQASQCSVQPGTPEDVGKILQILGTTKTPFAASVKGGGHTQNPGFSSTQGVQIALSRFNQVNYDSATQTAEVGAGLTWDDVYEALEPFGVNVIGGRVSGVGVAGFTLGGGYSWKTNRYGLTVDNVAAYELVLPNGTVTTVTQNSDSELFFGLKGGYNNFGIVTRFFLKTYPQTKIWGGVITITGSHLPQVNAAITKFSRTVTDPKAAILPTYNTVEGLPGMSLILFYDWPTPPAGIFEDFLAVPSFTKDISTRSFLSLVQAPPTGVLRGTRGVFHTVPVMDYSASILNAVMNESSFYALRLPIASGFFISYDVEPFLPSILSHAPASSAAYPPTRDRTYTPLNIYFAWAFPASDELMRESAVRSAEQLMAVAMADGQAVSDAPLYGNYAISSTPRERIFGTGETWSRLKALKARIDPEGVMALAGGWKIE